MMSALSIQLNAALSSRKSRGILRKMPEQANHLVDFTTNDYLSLSTCPELRTRFLQKLKSAPNVLGSGGSRLLVNPQSHSQLESRLEAFFNVESALLFNSGYDANVGFFSCVPGRIDWVVYDEYIHASVHDGMRTSRVPEEQRISFAHNDIDSFSAALHTISSQIQPQASIFIAVESLYSMDGTFCPLSQLVRALDRIFPQGNTHLIVDEAHSTGIYGPKGKGRVAELRLEDRVLVRLCTFGKALGCSGAVLLTTSLLRDYLLNYARSLIYTTSLSSTSVIAVDCAFDLLEDGTAANLSGDLLMLSEQFIQSFAASNIPKDVLHLPKHLSSPGFIPSAIIPLHTVQPGHAHALAGYLARHHQLGCKPITFPTVPKGKERVRVCLHAGNTTDEVDKLITGIKQWVQMVLQEMPLISARL